MSKTEKGYIWLILANLCMFMMKDANLLSQIALTVMTIVAYIYCSTYFIKSLIERAEK